MAIIYSYPEKTTLADGDLFVITDSEQTAPNKNRTKSLKASDLKAYTQTGAGTVTSVSGDGTYVTGTITESGTFGFNTNNIIALINTSVFYNIIVDHNKATNLAYDDSGHISWKLGWKIQCDLDLSGSFCHIAFNHAIIF